MKTLFSSFLLFFGSLVFTHTTFASGGDYGGSYSNNSSSNDIQVDHQYELGKSVFTGRHPNYRKVEFCFIDNENAKSIKVKNKTIRSYKGGPVTTLLNDLYQCKNTNQSISDTLQKNHLVASLYYLNKRYKLNLK